MKWIICRKRVKTEDSSTKNPWFLQFTRVKNVSTFSHFSLFQFPYARKFMCASSILCQQIHEQKILLSTDKYPFISRWHLYEMKLLRTHIDTLLYSHNLLLPTPAFMTVSTALGSAQILLCLHSMNISLFLSFLSVFRPHTPPPPLHHTHHSF